MPSLVLERGHHGLDPRLPVLVWRADEPVHAVSSAVLGGGIGLRSWVVNAQVPLSYHHRDPAAHALAIAADHGLAESTGCGMLTAADVGNVTSALDGGVTCDATVGVSTPTWAAAPDGEWSTWSPGTINLVCWIPVPMADAALVNAVVTATEAKTQALLERGVPGTGTASDAIVICAPAPSPGAGEPEAYGGPRSTWGARLARAVHLAVAAGTEQHPAVQA
jgi:adenosylcobinamide amidohydrolase